MRFVGVGAPCCERRRRRIGRRRSEWQSNTDTMTGGRPSECWSITDRLGRWTVSTIEPVTMRAARLVTRPELAHDNGTPA
jgi:hypothetical protein